MVEKTIPVPERYVDRFKELIKLETEIYDIKREHEIKATQLWTELEKDLDLRGKGLKFNKEKFTIKIIDSSAEIEAEMVRKMREGKTQMFDKTPINLKDVGLGKAMPRISGERKASLWERIKNSLK